jgi:hypothetical protein
MNDLTDFKRFVKRTDIIKNINKTVWCYTRVSSKEQESNYSLTTQKESAERFAREKGYQLMRVFGSTYESGKDDFTRKEFTNLLLEVKKSRNKPFAILVNIMNRFSRSGGKSIGILNEIVDNQGVHLIEVISGISTETPKGRNEINRRLLEAEGDNIRKLEVSIPGMKAFLRAGNWLGKAPLGFDHIGPRTTDHNRYNSSQKIVVNETGMKLRQAWQWKLEGVQDYIIVKRLNDLEVKMSLQRLSDMWRNPFYCGLITNRLLDGEIIEGHHELLVSREVFLKINHINTKRPQGYNIDKHCENRPLIGDILCYNCGRKLSGYLVKKKGLHYYKCQKCKGVTINAITRNENRIGAHELFVNLLSSYELKTEFFTLVKDQLIRMVKLTNNSIKKEESLFKKRLSELERDRENLEKRFAFGKIEEPLYQKFLRKIDDEIMELREKNDIPEITTSNFKNSLNKTMDFIQNISKYWISGNINVKKRIQRLIFPSGFFINPVNRQYLTPEINQLFRLTTQISMSSEETKKRIPIKNDEDSVVVAGSGSSLKKHGTD